MDIIALDAFLTSSFFLNFAVSFLANETAQAAKRFIKRTFKKENLDDQLVDALNDSLIETCKKFNIQYQEGVTLNEFIASIANSGGITTMTLRKILEDVVVIKDSNKFMDKWIISFQKAVAKPEREWLFNFLLMQNKIVDDRLKTDNARYADNFEEVMFLHTEAEHKIRLCDLYIPPNRNAGQNKKTESKSEELIAYIKSFVESNNFDALILEGDAGVGKTSFVSYIAHMYLKETKEWAYYFGARELISIRLRDLIPDSGSFSKKSICNDVLKYLNVEMKSKNQFKDEHKDAVVILDGFDELCMIEDIKEHHGYYIKELCRLFENCKVIITTRPHYLSIDDLREKDVHCNHMRIDHFRSKQRVEWVKRYKEAVCVVDEEETAALNYILSIDNDNIMGICDTPMTLYMLAKGRIDEDARDNIWALYHQIFYKEITETEYNTIFPSEYGDSHPIEEYSKYLYRLNAEIAYRMYELENETLQLNEKEIENILDKLDFFNMINSNIKKIIKSCYALCSYWKKTSDKGAVEFYHNNIRDFFMCEKIFYFLDKIYQEENPDFKQIVKEFQSFFSKEIINLKVLSFLYHRITYEKNKPLRENFMKRELDVKLIENDLISRIIGVGNNDYEAANSQKTENTHIAFLNTLYLYKVAYEPYLNNFDKIYWIGNRDNKNGFFISEESLKLLEIQSNPRDKYLLRSYLISSVFRETLALEKNINIHMACKSAVSGISFSNISFLDADFSSIVFYDCEFNYCSFEYANLENVTFERCFLLKCSFSKANLTGCIIVDSEFTDVILDDVKLPDEFSSSDINEIIGHMEQLNYFVSNTCDGRCSFNYYTN